MSVSRNWSHIVTSYYKYLNPARNSYPAKDKKQNNKNLGFASQH